MAINSNGAPAGMPKTRSVVSSTSQDVPGLGDALTGGAKSGAKTGLKFAFNPQIFPDELSSFELVREGKPNEKIMFINNPTEYTVEKDVNYVFAEVPGLSDPIGQFMSGGRQNITVPFTLTDIYSRVSLDPEDNYIISVINLLESWMVPDRITEHLNKMPPKIIFRFGPKVHNVRILKLRYRITHFHPTLAPRRADCQLDLFHVIHEHRQPRDFLQSF